MVYYVVQKSTIDAFQWKYWKCEYFNVPQISMQHTRALKDGFVSKQEIYVT